MKIRYLELVGKQVVGADGQPVGRIADLIAGKRGEELKVIALRVGPVAMFERIGFKRGVDRHLRSGLEVPWKLVARIEKKVHLRVSRSELDQFKTGAKRESKPGREAPE